MKLHRFTITPASPWGSLPASDTLYGLLMWRIAERDGDAAVKKSIADFIKGAAPFAISCVMPKDMLPAPVLPPIPRSQFRSRLRDFGLNPESGEDLFAALAEFKKFRKLAWLPVSAWLANAGRLSMVNLYAWHCQNREAPASDREKSGFEPHVTIDRQNGGALQGGLFFSRLLYFKDSAYHLYAAADEPDLLLELLKLVGLTGFGRDASTGHGSFQVEYDAGFDCGQLIEPYAGQKNCELMLGSFASQNMQNLDGWYKLETRFCKAGPGMGSPYKNPIICLKPGAVLSKVPQGPYVLEHIHSNPDVAQIFHPLSLPCVMEA